jgi:tetratricopeptide (TPR) repeat protein
MALTLLKPVNALSKTVASEEEVKIFNNFMDKGLEYNADGRYEKALEQLHKADQIMISPFTKFWIGKSYLSLRQFDQAEKFFTQAIKYYKSKEYMKDRYYAEACAGKAFLLYKKGEYTKARDYLEIAYKNSDDESDKDLYAIVTGIINELLKK